MKEIRDSRNLSQQQLADAIGEAQSSLAGWEAGRSTPRYTTLIKLVDYLNVSLDYLAGRSDLPDITERADRKFILSTHEKALLLAYRNLTKPERRMIDKQLDIPLSDE